MAMLRTNPCIDDSGTASMDLDATASATVDATADLDLLPISNETRVVSAASKTAAMVGKGKQRATAKAS